MQTNRLYTPQRLSMHVALVIVVIGILALELPLCSSSVLESTASDPTSTAEVSNSSVITAGQAGSPCVVNDDCSLSMRCDSKAGVCSCKLAMAFDGPNCDQLTTQSYVGVFHLFISMTGWLYLLQRCAKYIQARLLEGSMKTSKGFVCAFYVCGGVAGVVVAVVGILVRLNKVKESEKYVLFNTTKAITETVIGIVTMVSNLILASIWIDIVVASKKLSLSRQSGLKTAKRAIFGCSMLFIACYPPCVIAGLTDIGNAVILVFAVSISAVFVYGGSTLAKMLEEMDVNLQSGTNNNASTPNSTKTAAKTMESRAQKLRIITRRQAFAFVVMVVNTVVFAISFLRSPSRYIPMISGENIMTTLMVIGHLVLNVVGPPSLWGAKGSAASSGASVDSSSSPLTKVSAVAPGSRSSIRNSVISAKQVQPNTSSNFVSAESSLTGAISEEPSQPATKPQQWKKVVEIIPETPPLNKRFSTSVTATAVSTTPSSSTAPPTSSAVNSTSSVTRPSQISTSAATWTSSTQR